MERRRLLALGGLSVLTSLSGCAVGRGWCSKRRALSSDPPESPAGMTVETASWSMDLVAPRGGDRPYTVVATSRTEANETVVFPRGELEDLDPRTFIEQTNFDNSYLILVEWMGTSSSDKLSLSRIERQEQGVHLTAEVIEPCGARAGDISVHSLFVRVSDERTEAPERVTVHVDE